MDIQVALDRVDLKTAGKLAQDVGDYVDYVEVGTSLIKEFGIESVRFLRRYCPGHKLVADMKTCDNAIYEMTMCFEAGADVATVLAISPVVTIQSSIEVARSYGKTIMIDLMNAPGPLVKHLVQQFPEQIFCAHLSKDVQGIETIPSFYKTISKPFKSVQWAVAGGIDLARLKGLRELDPNIIIIGQAITGASNPRHAAKRIFQLLGDGIEDA